jgi:hypothetical protein
MSRFTNRPQSEYESAAFAALEILLAEAVRRGSDAIELKRKLIEAAEDRASFGATNGAAFLKMLAEPLAT